MAWCMSLVAVAQDAEPSVTPSVTRSQVSAYFIPLKVTYEHGIGQSNVIELGAGVTGDTRFVNETMDFRFMPFIDGSFKNYYNLEKRQQKGKFTAMNSGNYWGIGARYGFATTSDDVRYSDVVFVSPFWGLQRNYGSHLSLGLNLGYGVGLRDDDLYTDFYVDFKLGFVLYSR